MEVVDKEELIELVEKLPAISLGDCLWTKRVGKSYNTSCNQVMTVMEVMIASEFRYRYCPYCGKKVKVSEGQEKYYELWLG